MQSKHGLLFVVTLGLTLIGAYTLLSRHAQNASPLAGVWYQWDAVHDRCCNVVTFGGSGDVSEQGSDGQPVFAGQWLDTDGQVQVRHEGETTVRRYVLTELGQTCEIVNPDGREQKLHRYAPLRPDPY